VVSLSAGFLVLAAFLAGLVSFSSPCCLPLLPGYVAYVSGEAVSRPQHVRRTMTAAGLFTLGFGVTFTALGASASWLGAVLLAGRPGLIRAAGVLVAAVGALTVAGAEPRVLARERRLLRLDRVPRGPVFAAPLGAAFALGWTPCIGPVLAGLLAAAAASPTMLAGASLLGVYSAGLAVPFLGLAWMVARGRDRRGEAVGLLGRRHRVLAYLGGTLLVAMGLAMVAGWWARLFGPLLRWFARSGWPPI
jgi:cytochrome c-type biogenesis protein